MALTNPQGKLILSNDDASSVFFTADGNFLNTTGSLVTNIVTSGLQTYLRFNNNMFDDNPNNPLGHNASVTSGVAAYATGANNKGQAFSFDGSTWLDVDNTITATTNIRPSGSWTIDFWAKLTTNSTSKAVYNGSSFGNGFGVALDDNGGSFTADSIRVNITDAGLSVTNYVNVTSNSGGAPTFSTTAFNHYSITFSNNTYVKIFVNKILVAYNTSGYNGTGYSGTGNTVGAEMQVTPTRKFTGLIDNLKIYNRAITDGSTTTVGNTATGEVAQNYIAEGGL